MRKEKICYRILAFMMICVLVFSQPLQVNAAEKSSETATTSKDKTLTNVAPKQPKSIISEQAAEKSEKNFDDWLNSVFQTGAIAKMVDSLDRFVGDTTKSISVLEKKLVEKAIKDAKNLWYPRVGYKLPEGMTPEKIAAKINEAADNAVAANSKTWKNYLNGPTKFLTAAAVCLNLYVAANDVNDLVKGDLKNRTTAGKVLETTGLVADAGVAIWGIVCTGGALLGASVTAVPLAVGVGVGIAAGTLHSEWFADWFHEYGEEIDKSFGNPGYFWNKTKDNAEALWDYIAEKLGIRTKVPNDTNCYKPNIYIYSASPTEVTLEFSRPDLLTKTIPDYSGKWKVWALGDGRLADTCDDTYAQYADRGNGTCDQYIDITDGKLMDMENDRFIDKDDNENTYGYLFYESKTQTYFFQKETAWLIQADTRKEQYEKILGEYSFNEQEIADFVEFWVEKLPKDRDYLMYPQGTDIVNRAMPVTINPEPDSIERLWFAFETYHGQNYEEAQAEQIVRDKYAVVEWGGVILDE